MEAVAPGVTTVAQTCARVRAAGAALRALRVETRAQAIATAANLLCDEGSEAGRALRAELTLRSGLSAPVIEWGLTTTLRRFDAPSLQRLYGQRARGKATVQDGLVVAVLAGNVFSAAARPLLLPLLCGLPCVAKGSSRDAALGRHLAVALQESSPELGAAIALLSWPRDGLERERALLSQASVAQLYGSDVTIAELRPLLPTSATLVPHGHGLGLALVVRGDDRDAARALARDVCAYDQRGCLSPHAVFVLDDAERFAHELGRALDELQARWPRGSLTQAAATEQLQWRGVAAARGELHATQHFAVSYEGGEPLRASCGYRNVGVYACASVDAFVGQARALGAQLKALGTDCNHAALRGLAPYVCALGQMQDPPLSARLDGFEPLEGMQS